MRHCVRGLGTLLVALLLLSALSAIPVAAAPVVSTCNDSGTGSLREAIAAAVAGDTITFSVNCPSGAGTQITLASMLTIAQNNLTIDATGHTIVVDGGNNGFTVFTVTGGTVAQPVTLKGLTIQHGYVVGFSVGLGNGGGIANSGTLTVTNSTLTGNHAYSASYADGNGGGIYNTGALTVTNSNLSANISADGGGIYNTGTLTVTNSNLSANDGGTDGGGIAGGGTMVVTNSTFSGNSAYASGGIANSGTLTVTNSTFSGNQATGLSTGGGGIGSNGALTVTNSTFSANSAPQGSGGGIQHNGGTLTVTNSTFVLNHADVEGGGLEGGGALTVTNSTFSGNSANGRGGFGGGGISTSGMTAVNTLIAGNTTAGSGTGPDVNGAFATGSKSNLLGIASGATGIADNDANHNIVGHPALLGSLGNYGGPTQTIPLLAGSPAIDHGDDATCINTSGIAPVAGKDQRGITRPQGPHCDIGAFELAQTPPVPTGLHVTGATYNSLTWSWAESDATAPLIYTVDGSHFYGLPAGTTTFTLSGIAYGSYACISIAAYNANGASGYTPYSCSYVVPITPYNPHQTAGTTSTGTISWANYDALSNEQVYDYSGAAWHQVGVNGTSYTLTGIPAGYYHCAAVQAYNVNYASGYSYACPFATPNAPTNIHATSVSQSSVTFAWDAPDPYSWYYVYETAPAAGHVVTATSFTTTHIIVSGQHGYACIYVGAGGYGGTSATFPYACAWAY